MRHVAASPEVFTVSAAGIETSVERAGSGSPLVLFPRDTGRPAWGEFQSLLARRFTVLSISYPGYDWNPVPEWMRHPSDLASYFGYVLDKLGVERATAVGLGFGGWVAATAAVHCSKRFENMVLHAPMGIKPPSGEIFDQILVWARDYVRHGFSDRAKFTELYGETPSEEQERVWDVNREMTTRIAFKPYMYDQSLPHLLVGVSLPTRVIASGRDEIVPRSCAVAYANAIPGAQLIDLPEAGHQADLEHPRELADAILEFAVTSREKRSEA
jgi:pimeloyl-ACP methyl ester carboxylesterase